MTGHGPTPEQFFAAIQRGNELAVDSAIAADPSLLRARNASGLSPVLVAAYYRHFKLAERIAATAEKVPDGLSVFDAAAVGKVDVVRTMLSGDRASVDDHGPDGFTALHLAAFFGQLETTRLLLGRGADPNAVALNDSRVTPLHAAARDGDEAIVDMLLLRGADATRKSDDGKTAADLAEANGHASLARLLRGSASKR